MTPSQSATRKPSVSDKTSGTSFNELTAAILDEDPSLFFVLRKMKMDDLITQAVRDKSARLLKQAEKKTSRVIDDADMADVFGIEMESAAAAENDGAEAATIEPDAPAKARRRGPAKKATKKQTTKKVKKVVKKTKRGSHARMKK